MYACIIQETFVFKVFRRVFHSILKLELCRQSCRRRNQIIPTCRYGKNMPTTALHKTHTCTSPLGLLPILWGQMSNQGHLGSLVSKGHFH